MRTPCATRSRTNWRPGDWGKTRQTPEARARARRQEQRDQRRGPQPAETGQVRQGSQEAEGQAAQEREELQQQREIAPELTELACGPLVLDLLQFAGADLVFLEIFEDPLEPGLDLAGSVSIGSRT